MILRVYRAVVHEGQQAAFRAFFEETAIPTLEATDGMERLIVGWPRPEDPCGFSMIQVWRDLPALIAFTGARWQDAVVHPDEAHLIKETSVHHYEVD